MVMLTPQTPGALLKSGAWCGSERPQLDGLVEFLCGLRFPHEPEWLSVGQSTSE